MATKKSTQTYVAVSEIHHGVVDETGQGTGEVIVIKYGDEVKGLPVEDMRRMFFDGSIVVKGSADDPRTYEDNEWEEPDDTGLTPAVSGVIHDEHAKGALAPGATPEEDEAAKAVAEAQAAAQAQADATGQK